MLFLTKGITSVIIPDSVTEIGDMAFAMTSLTSITIPNNFTSLYSNTFNSILAVGTVYVSGGTSDAFNSVLLGAGIPSTWTITNLAVSNIAVKTKPTTIKYFAGDNFDPTGLVITATYNNGMTKDIVYNNTTKDDFKFSKGQLNVSDNKVTITYGNKSVDLEITVENRIYNFAEGTNQAYTQNQDDTATFKIDADYSLFNPDGKVYVDDVLLKSSEFNSKKGSTIISLTKEYMNTLSEGSHTLKVVFNDNGVATTKFTVAKKNNTSSNEESTNGTIETKSNNPKTGDNIVIWISLMVVSMIGIVLTIKFVKK